MTQKEFFKKITHDKEDFLQTFINLLESGKIPCCLIGGLAVNAYADPVVSLDLDIVIVAAQLGGLIVQLKKKFQVEEFPNSINVAAKGSDLRIQIQKDSRYQAFIPRASRKNLLGFPLMVAAVEDVFQGKIWAASDPSRRPSKRQKDLSDILRLIETKPELEKLLPEALKKKIRN